MSWPNVRMGKCKWETWFLIMPISKKLAIKKMNLDLFSFRLVYTIDDACFFISNKVFLEEL